MSDTDYYKQDYSLLDIFLPNYILAVKQLEKPSEIYGAFKSLKIHGAIYGIFYCDKPIKFGYTFPKDERKNPNVFGERIVRQLSFCPGWKHQFGHENKPSGILKPNYGWIPESPNGEDFFYDLENFAIENNITIDSKKIYVKIWNITSLKSTWAYFDYESDEGKMIRGKYFEGLIVQQYKDEFNHLPVGNRASDPSKVNNAFTKPKLLASAMECFEFA